jgi:hypothetical protein
MLRGDLGTELNEWPAVHDSGTWTNREPSPILVRARGNSAPVEGALEATMD